MSSVHVRRDRVKDAADRVSQWSNEEDGVARELEATVHAALRPSDIVLMYGAQLGFDFDRI